VPKSSQEGEDWGKES